LRSNPLTERGQVSRAEDIFIYDRINSTWVVLFDLILRAENLFTRRNRLLLSKREKWNALEAGFGKGVLIGGDGELLTELPEEIFLRFERPKTVWFELAYVEILPTISWVSLQCL
jgi:hypothetical protein